MPIELIYFAVVFLVIIGILAFKRPLYQAISGGLIVCILLYRIPPKQILICMSNVFTEWSSLSVLISLYLITYLQQMLIGRNMIKAAQNDLNDLFRSKRASTLSTSFFFGLLPSAASTIFLGDIIKDSTKEHLDVYEQAFVTSWYRHIPESFLPTYSFILLFATLADVNIAEFIACMIVPIIVMFLVGYHPYITKLPKASNAPASGTSKKEAFIHLIQHMWPIILILVLIIGLDLSVVASALISIAVTILVHRFRMNELVPLTKTAFEVHMLVSSFLCLVFKEFIEYADVLKLLPEALSGLPIPTYLIFALMFFIGGFVSTSGIIAIGAPLAFSTLPGGAPLMMMLMSICHAANQLSPTHICVVLAAEHFDIPLGTLARRVAPRALIFCVFVILYYNVLILF